MMLILAIALIVPACKQPTSSTPAAKPVDKTALAAKITEATALITDTARGETAGEVSNGVHYVTAAEQAALQTALTAAITARDKTGATQTEINTAKNALDAAITTFIQARDSKTGSRQGSLDFTSLSAKITEAETLLGDTAVSDAAADVPSGQHYVTTEEKAAFQTAITAAKAELTRAQNNTTTPAAIAAAVTALENAIATFNAAKASHTGTKAEWSYIISFNLNYTGAGANPDSITITNPHATLADAGKALPQPEPRTGYTFTGWFDNAAGDGAAFTASTTISRDTQLYAQWRENLDAAALSAAISSAETLLGDTAVSDAAADVPSGQHYVTTEEKAAFQTAITAAKAELTRAQNNTTTQAAINAAVTALEGAVTTFNAAKASHTGTKAEWSYIISFNLNYTGAGANPDSITITNPHATLADAGKALPQPEPRTGYTFTGWFDNAAGTGEQFTINTTLSGNKQLYAKWLQAPADYTVTYHLNGGTLSGDGITVTGDAATETRSGAYTLPPPAKERWRFRGWYDNEQCTGSAVTSVSGGAGSQEFWAKWEQYKIILHMDGGTVSSVYTMENGDAVLRHNGSAPINSLPPGSIATKPGCTLEGWYDSAEKTNKVTAAPVVPANTYEDKEFWANWTTRVEYELAFNGSLTNALPSPAVVSMGAGAASYQAGPVSGKQAIKLDQANYINLGQNFDYSQSFTIAFWINVTGSVSPSDAAVFGNKRWDSGGGSARGFVLCMTGSSLKVNVGNGSTLGDVGLGDVKTNWAHVAVTFDVPGNTVKYYYNGNLVTTKTGISGGLNSGLNSYIGQTAGNAADSSRYNTAMTCLMQDFVLKGGAMSDADIAALANPVLTGEPPKPELTFALGTSPGTIDYSWTTGGLPGLIEYKLYYKQGSSIAADGSDGALAATQTGACAYSGSLSSLIAGETYSAVLSLTRGGHTVYSDAKTVTMPAFAAPELAVTTPIPFTGASAGTISYSWTAANPADGVTYTLYYKEGTAIAADGSDGALATTQSGAYSGTLSGLTPGATYSFILKAVRGTDTVYSAVKQATAYKSVYEMVFNGSLDNVGDGALTMTGTEDYEDNARDGRKAIKLNQANYINLGQTFDYTQSFTIAFWVKVTTTGNTAPTDAAVFGNKRWNSGGGTVKGFILCMTGSSLKVNVGNGSSSLGDVGLGDVKTNWAHVAVTFDVPGNTVKYYYNGSLVTTKTGISGGLNSGLNSYIGQTAGNNTDSSRYNTNMACQIQDFLLKSGTMTDTEIAALAAP